MSSPTPPRIDNHLRDELATILHTRRDVLTRQLELIEDELPEQLVDGPDRPSTGAEARLRFARTDRALEQVDHALAQLDRPDFGRCTACGVAIAAERLLALPGTVQCAGCAR